MYVAPGFVKPFNHILSLSRQSDTVHMMPPKSLFLYWLSVASAFYLETSKSWYERGADSIWATILFLPGLIDIPQHDPSTPSSRSFVKSTPSSACFSPFAVRVIQIAIRIDHPKVVPHSVTAQDMYRWSAGMDEHLVPSYSMQPLPCVASTSFN
ncbi:hypothetical protein SISSUDRAFT_1067902 [Sistotremastrum suecicum HHB10207 ss-3]|uniref:Uncharacterized protein n=1 Tax=Sistotremastrum suecicum HHB10207 ss-3 TaxID=1314776 RepID=A0A165WKP5_9AGAM|nr:hypothetical protein SISSUDRAFT_1067902 [Sistotremastrum suecicum HHB10207 ss-3]